MEGVDLEHTNKHTRFGFSALFRKTITQADISEMTLPKEDQTEEEKLQPNTTLADEQPDHRADQSQQSRRHRPAFQHSAPSHVHTAGAC